MKICSVVGARPQFIKLAPLCHALNKLSTVEHSIVHTGQHYDPNMSEVFFNTLEIPNPDINLGISNGSHAEMTAQMLVKLEKAFLKIKPDTVVVFGDTNSTLAAALAAAKIGIPISHIEAGLRSYNRAMPEEINRIVTDELSDLLFTPTKSAADILHTENKKSENIINSGDIMLDASRLAIKRANSDATLRNHNVTKNNYIIATLHRAENTDDPNRLQTWIRELNSIGANEHIILPIHPRTLKKLKEYEITEAMHSNISLISPLDFIEMTTLVANSKSVITDSGGVQKEAYFHSRPCLILRNETEWNELLATGWSALVQCKEHALEQAFHKHKIPNNSETDQVFGDGNAATKICDALMKRFSK